MGELAVDVLPSLAPGPTCMVLVKLWEGKTVQDVVDTDLCCNLDKEKVKLWIIERMLKNHMVRRCTESTLSNVHVCLKVCVCIPQHVLTITLSLNISSISIKVK